MRTWKSLLYGHHSGTKHIFSTAISESIQKDSRVMFILMSLLTRLCFCVKRYLYDTLAKGTVTSYMVCFIWVPLTRS